MQQLVSDLLPALDSKPSLWLPPACRLPQTKQETSGVAPQDSPMDSITTQTRRGEDHGDEWRRRRGRKAERVESSDSQRRETVGVETKRLCCLHMVSCQSSPQRRSKTGPIREREGRCHGGRGLDFIKKKEALGLLWKSFHSFPHIRNVVGLLL